MKMKPCAARCRLTVAAQGVNGRELTGERVGLRLEGNKDPLSFDNPEETLSWENEPKPPAASEQLVLRKNESWPNQNNRAKINDYPLWVSFGHVPTLQTQHWSQTVTSSLPKTVLPFIHSKAQDSPDDNMKSSSKSSFHYGLGDFYYLNWFDRFLAEVVHKHTDFLTQL